MKPFPLLLAGLTLIGMVGTSVSAQDGGWRLFGTTPRENPYDEPLVTDRPDFTEASSTVGRGVVQLETGYTYSYHDDESTGDISHSHSGPEMLYRIGIADPIELRIAWNHQWDRVDSGPFALNSDGAQDLYFGAKLALRDEEGLRPEQAVILQGTAPTGDDDYTTGSTEFGINYLYSWSLPNDWGLSASTGFDTNTAGSDEFLEWHQSVAVGIPLSDSVSVYVEYFGIYTHGQAVETNEHYVNGGFAWLVGYNV